MNHAKGGYGNQISRMENKYEDTLCTFNYFSFNLSVDIVVSVKDT